MLLTKHFFEAACHCRTKANPILNGTAEVFLKSWNRFTVKKTVFWPFNGTHWRANFYEKDR
jgi:hypothetical protein